jgi:uncharacterized cupin superfamily protein
VTDRRIVKELSFSSFVLILYFQGGALVERIQVEKLEDSDVHSRGIDEWGIWEKEPSEFDWYYNKEEHCYIIEGSAHIEAPYGQVEIQKGDYVVFPVGLKCRWKISERIKKHYEFR